MGGRVGEAREHQPDTWLHLETEEEEKKKNKETRAIPEGATGKKNDIHQIPDLFQTHCPFKSGCCGVHKVEKSINVCLW